MYKHRAVTRLFVSSCITIITFWFVELYTANHATIEYTVTSAPCDSFDSCKSIIFCHLVCHFSFDLFTFNNMIYVLRRGLWFSTNAWLLFDHNITMYSYDNGYADKMDTKKAYYDFSSMYHHIQWTYMHLNATHIKSWFTTK